MTRLLSILLFTAAFLIVFPSSALAGECEELGGVCAPSREDCLSKEGNDIGNTEDCESPRVCCVFGTRVTGEAESASKGETTVGYGLKNPMGSRTVPQIIGAIIGWLAGLAGALFMLYLIWGGIEWMTAGGSPEQLKSGQRKIIYAIVGAGIAALSYIIVDAIVGLTSIPPGT
jgi:hypothetical protein